MRTRSPSNRPESRPSAADGGGRRDHHHASATSKDRSTDHHTTTATTTTTATGSSDNSNHSSGKSRGFTAVNGRARSSHHHSSTDLTGTAAEYRTANWRPADDRRATDNSVDSAMGSRAVNGKMPVAISDGDPSDDESTIRVTRLPRKRKRPEPDEGSKAATHIEEPKASPPAPTLSSEPSPPPPPRPPPPPTTTSQTQSQRPPATTATKSTSSSSDSPKRRRSELDIVNDWNAHAKSAHLPSLHLTTEEPSPGATDHGLSARNSTRASPRKPSSGNDDVPRPRPADVNEDDALVVSPDGIGAAAAAHPTTAPAISKSDDTRMSSPVPRLTVADDIPGDTIGDASDEVEHDHDDNDNDNDHDHEPGPTDAKPKQEKRKRQFSSRTKSGCHTCRSRKKKCDEGKPICANCQRGGFPCGGYGPKPPNFKSLHSARVSIPLSLQSKQPSYNPSGRSDRYFPLQASHPQPPPPHVPGPTHAIAYDEMMHDRGSRASGLPTQRDVRPSYVEAPHRVDGGYPPGYYHQHPPGPNTWPGPERARGHPPPPPPSHTPHPAPVSYPSSERYALQELHARPAPTAGRHYDGPPAQTTTPIHQGPPPSAHEWPPPHAPSTRYAPTQSSVATVRSAGSSNQSNPYSNNLTVGPLAVNLGFPSHQVEKDKMLRGKPFKHWLDPTLIEDRRDCRTALNHFNDAASRGAVPHTQQTLFHQILQPLNRPPPPPPSYGPRQDRPPHQGPSGHPGVRTLVAAPFDCMYGYNLNFGEDCVVEAGCLFQDAATISIGDRAIIGNDVQLLCLSVSVDPRQRAGSKSEVSAGAITIEEDVFIGAGAKILAYRTIGKGAVVAAGAVVTTDVDPYTVVAGVPARRIRDNDAGAGPERKWSKKIWEQDNKMREKMTQRVEQGFQSLSPRSDR